MCFIFPIRDFASLLAADEKVGAHLSKEDVARLFDVHHALRHVGAIIDRALSDEIQ